MCRLLHMSLVVEASPSSPTTATSTTSIHEGAEFCTFALPSSPEPPSSGTSSLFTPIRAVDPLFLRSSHHRRSPLASVLARTPPKRSCSSDKDFQASVDCDGEVSTPAKKAAKRSLDLDPFAVFDSNSRDSGFESEASRLSYSLSTSSGGGVNSNPGTPASSASSHSIGSGLCLTPISHDDPLVGAADGTSTVETGKSTHLCLWDDCGDPSLLLEEDDDSRRDLLSHVLSRHVQPLEVECGKSKDDDQPASFRCLWRSCKVYGKGSRLYSWLEGHVIERHAGPRPFACPLAGCRLRFGSKLLAERHINSHFADDHPPAKEKDSCKMAPSNLVSKPSPISYAAFRDTAKSPLSKQQQIAVNTRASAAKRRLLEEECQQPYRRPEQKPLDRLTAKTRRETAIQRRLANGSKAVKESLTVEKTTSTTAVRTRHGGKMRVDIDSSLVRKSRQRESSSGGAKGVEARSARKQFSSNSTSSSQARTSSLVSSNKKSTPASSAEVGISKAVSALETTGTTAATGIGGAVKRKTVRVRNLPEDAFDAMHARAIHVLAARVMLSIKKRADASHGGKNSPSCHECSGNSYGTDTSSSSLSNCRRSEVTSRHCVCSNYVTFHAKVLAKRTCSNGEKITNESSRPQCELFCSWTPAGLLPPKWVEESSFQSIIRLPRSLFPSLVARQLLEAAADQLT